MKMKVHTLAGKDVFHRVPEISGPEEWDAVERVLIRFSGCLAVRYLFLVFFWVVCHSIVLAASGALELTIDVSKPGEEIDLTCYALGQGGLSDKPMFDSHVERYEGEVLPSILRAVFHK